MKGLPPIVDRKTDKLILGTFPSEISLKNREYFANPKNQFWDILCVITNIPKHREYAKRVQALLRHRIGIWDTINQCERKGSSDNQIRDPKVNEFTNILKKYASIKFLFFNGNKAFEIFSMVPQNLEILTNLEYRILPSTSPANTHLSFQEKSSIWTRALVPHKD